MNTQDSYSVLRDIDRDTLVDLSGRNYIEFRNDLTPRYGLVWLHIGLGYLALVSVAFLFSHTQGEVSTLAWPLAVMIGGFIVGYIIHYMHLFMHEAAHFNLASNRDLNDRLANLCVGLLVGMQIGPYRPIHLAHHRHLGTPLDTEISYFLPLDKWLILGSMTGIIPLQTLFNRSRHDRPTSTGGESSKRSRILSFSPLLISCAMHIGIALYSASLGHYLLSIAWLIGVFAVFPFLGSLRVLLEHRSVLADKNVDYHKQDHGETIRMFGTGPIASTFGQAGFNRHLLHHWEPRISYTRLAELENFLMKTEQGKKALESARTTYLATFKQLYNR